MEQKYENPLAGVLMIVLAAMIWGSAFVAQRMGMDSAPPLTFNAVRSAVGVAALVPVIALFDRKAGRRPLRDDPAHSRRMLLRSGLICGVVLTAASNFQQLGIAGSGAGKAGFITALYIVLVPVFGLFLKKKTSPLVWGSVAVALVGMYLLCINGAFSISQGDAWLLLCAVCYAVHILTVDRVCPYVDGVRLSCLQFAVCAVLSAALAALFERPTLSGVLAAWIPILYAGVLSSGVAYTLQILGQKRCPPQIASLGMSLESVFAMLCGAIVLHERLSLREGIGCVLMFAAILISQLPTFLRRKNA